MTNLSEKERDALTRLQAVWENHAKEDPLWAILTDSAKIGRKWDLAEFFQTGEREIDGLLETLALHQIDFDFAAALDFGCGVGRLSQALSRKFQSVSGVDISPTMIETAKSLNQYKDSCSYFLNARRDLQIFKDETFSFIYSNIVLQHIPPDLIRQYLAEFSRVLKPDGLLVFHLPSRLRSAEGLPPGAWVASLQCPDQQFSWPISSSAAVKLRIQNESPFPWRYESEIPILLGNHWIDDAGQMIRQDDGRAMLPNSLSPGNSAEVEIQIRTPPVAGRYVVEFDLVQEGVAWFKDKGSNTLSIPAEIFSPGTDKSMLAARPDPRSSDTDEPVISQTKATFEGFAMWYIPRAEVIRFLSKHHMLIEFLEPSVCGGPGFQSYAYVARRDSGRE